MTMIKQWSSSYHSFQPRSGRLAQKIFFTSSTHLILTASCMKHYRLKDPTLALWRAAMAWCKLGDTPAIPSVPLLSWPSAKNIGSFLPISVRATTLSPWPTTDERRTTTPRFLPRFRFLFRLSETRKQKKNINPTNVLDTYLDIFPPALSVSWRHFLSVSLSLSEE